MNNYSESMGRRDSSNYDGGRNYSMVRFGRENPWSSVMDFLESFFDEYDERPDRADRFDRYSRNQPRTSTGRFRRMRFSRDTEQEKESIGRYIGRSMSNEDIKDLVIKEASSVIKKISEDKVFEALKEFCELSMAMHAYCENVPEDIKHQASEEAIEGYERMFEDGRNDEYEYDQYERRSRRRGRR